MIDTLAPRRPRAGSGAATSTSRRRTRMSLDFLLPSIAKLRRGDLHLPRVRAGGRWPADARASGRRRSTRSRRRTWRCRRGRRLHRQPVRHRRRPAAAHAGLPLRPVEGPARRHRRVPHRQGDASRTCSSRSSARWRTTTPRAGTSTTRRSRTRARTRTSSCSRTSTTSAPSRSTRSRSTRRR